MTRHLARLLFAVAVIWTGVAGLMLATLRGNDQGISLAALALVWSGAYLLDRL